MTLEVGQPAPDFTLATDGGGTVSLTTGQQFNPTYSDLDNTWVYASTTRLAALALR